MALKLHIEGYNRAVYIIENGLEIIYESDWSAIKPTENDIDRYIETHSLEEYGEWFLGIDTDAGEKDLARYVYPWGDFNVLHVSALERTIQEAPDEIKRAAQRLLNMVEEQKKEQEKNNA